MAIDAFKDRIENEQLMTEYNLMSPVIGRLIVEVEDIEQQRGSIVIPRVLWSEYCSLVVKIEKLFKCVSCIQHVPAYVFLKVCK